MVLGLVYGIVGVDFVDCDLFDLYWECWFFEMMVCLNQYDIDIEELELCQFFFNGFWGVCLICFGLGVIFEVDLELVVFDFGLSLFEGVIVFWFGLWVVNYYQYVFVGLVENYGFDVIFLWFELLVKVCKLVLYGDGDLVMILYCN